MYEIEVTVTTYTPEELRLTADWPLIWLQAVDLPLDSAVPAYGRSAQQTELRRFRGPSLRGRLCRCHIPGRIRRHEAVRLVD
jgi:hypothetical protein